MTAVGIVLLVVFAIGAAIGVYALAAPRRRAARLPAGSAQDRQPLHATTEWTSDAGADFGELSESARCELIFAVAALDDERSLLLLEHALSDPSEAVALAAAHALGSRGHAGVVERHLASHPGERADRMAQTLALLGTEG